MWEAGRRGAAAGSGGVRRPGVLIEGWEQVPLAALLGRPRALYLKPHMPLNPDGIRWVICICGWWLTCCSRRRSVVQRLQAKTIYQEHQGVVEVGVAVWRWAD